MDEYSEHKIHILHELQTFHENYMKLKFQMRNLNVQHYGWNEEDFYRFHNTNIFIEVRTNIFPHKSNHLKHRVHENTLA